ncbi:LOW QUALITY PROTEIN: G-type lectin S-receptor-like serine/threonine-protein kinase RKS1 [Herrania umbratica]|uniref:Receptor-like serine/threonine-protein kinase n=1 Tax=Herrania umbratica TaxID=108875 RepID=A0A6J1AKF0_9ROSI|nr:LOW QUALITY PROTEIN: G-type lectin S-receptor-like serine/threonine-protein kinase RKS1 [Herrania umbratica]
MASKIEGYSVMLLLLCFLHPFSKATDTISDSQFIRDGMTLVSSSGLFALGFFSPGKSNKGYVGIWYNKLPQQTVVWLANRNSPIQDRKGVLTIKDGNLAIFHANEGAHMWSTNVSSTKYSFAKLLDSGNLVLYQKNHSHTRKIIWESFDYPAHVWLPGMKHGIDKRTGLNRGLTSWKSPDDPAPGEFVQLIDMTGQPQFYIYHQSRPYCRGGPWSGEGIAGVPEIPKSPYFNLTFVNNENEMSLVYTPYDPSAFHHFVLDELGVFQRLTWVDRTKQWHMFWSIPRDRCDVYKQCGLNGMCSSDSLLACKRLPGFEPKSPRDWILRDGSEGSEVSLGLGLKECEKECLTNCSCTAYAVADINQLGIGCVVWYGDLKDIREYPDGGNDIYIHVDAVELANFKKHSGIFSTSKRSIIVLVFGSTAAVFGILFGSSKRIKLIRNVKMKGNKEKFHEFLALNDMLDSNLLEDSEELIELLLFDLDKITAATNNFSDTNKLGEGGFGAVYKGQLTNGQDIAVKRLSTNSGQGIEEFKTEALLMSKLQHRNLVRLLGCCIQGKEKMLIYQHMPNKSLDLLIFDQAKRPLLDWRKRFHIILGIARGILYFHRDSRFRIIHRDLNASNILLDAEMNPKISDFGIARTFEGSETNLKTNNVMGTYGYMPPEYAIQGLFSEKSDVYSFGVLLLEIISGKKNSGYYYEDPSSNILGQAWDFWREDKAHELIDPLMERNSYPVDDILRCIQVGLLCVQGKASDRPTMATVVNLLGKQATMPPPKAPAYIMTNHSSTSCSINKVTVTIVQARE